MPREGRVGHVRRACSVTTPRRGCSPEAKLKQPDPVKSQPDNNTQGKEQSRTEMLWKFIVLWFRLVHSQRWADAVLQCPVAVNVWTILFSTLQPALYELMKKKPCLFQGRLCNVTSSWDDRAWKQQKHSVWLQKSSPLGSTNSEILVQLMRNRRQQLTQLKGTQSHCREQFLLPQLEWIQLMKPGFEMSSAVQNWLAPVSHKVCLSSLSIKLYFGEKKINGRKF